MAITLKKGVISLHTENDNTVTTVITQDMNPGLDCGALAKPFVIYDASLLVSYKVTKVPLFQNK